MNATDRSWVDQRLDENGYLSPVFIKGLDEFIEFARSKPSFMDGNKIRCPCKICHNKAYQEVDIVKYHLCKKGFVPNYTLWNRQGETSAASTSLGGDDTDMSFNELHEPSYREMVLDVAGPDLIRRAFDEEPNSEDKKFFTMLDASDRELWPGCEKVTQLSAVARLLNIKSEYRIPEQCFDSVCRLMKDGLPENNNMVDSLYDSKKLIQALGLPVEVIDCCRYGCMLYWKENKDLDQCKVCDAERYKTSRSASKCSLIPYTRMHYFPLVVCKVKPRGWVDVRKSDHRNAAFQEVEVEGNNIISTTEEATTSLHDDIVEYGDISSNDSDNDNNDENEGEFEYSTSTSDEEDDEAHYDNDTE